jgi:archaellum biogenesis ATPase FlaH
MKEKEIIARTRLLENLENMKRLKEAEMFNNKLCSHEDIKGQKLARRKTMGTIEYAKAYVSKGFSVIPLKPEDKRPAIESWKDYQTRKAAKKELEEWFGNGSQNNIGIVTGKISGIAVVDLDSEEAIQFAKENHFPQTPTVKTGKGRHLYYRYRDGIRNFQNRDDLPGIDLRGDGGYVVVPPSIHPSGRKYQWVEGKGFEDIPLADFPEWVLVGKPEHKKALRELYKGVLEGERNNSLTRIVGSLVSDELPFEDCLKLALAVNRFNNPPLPEEEVERTVSSIYERNHEKLSYCPSTYIRDNTDRSDFDPYKVLKRGRDLQKLDISVSWAVESLIPCESITLISGRGGIGKTWLSIQLADAVSKGEPFMELKTIQTPVIYVDFENSLPVLVERINKVGALEALFWHATEDPRPPRLDSENWHVYRRLHQGSLLIFDTLRAAQSKDENDSRHMAFIMTRLKELRDCGLTIVLLHHTPKASDRVYKGSTAISDLADHVLSLYKVRKTNPDVIQEDDDDSDCYYRFGTRDKTRYEPFHMFLSFNPEKAFEKTQDPDIEVIDEIHQLIMEKGRMNQSQVFELVQQELGIKSKQKLVSLLRRGEGKYWTAEREGRAVYYSDLSHCPDLYTPDNRTIETNPSDLSKGETIVLV